MTDISEIFDIPKTEEEPKKEEPKKEEEPTQEQPKEEVKTEKPVKIKKPRKPLTDERREQLREQLKRGREKSRLSRMKAAQDNKKVKKQLLNTDLEGEIKKLQNQISNMTLKKEEPVKEVKKEPVKQHEPVKEIKKQIEVKKVEPVKELVRVRKLGKFDYSKYF